MQKVFQIITAIYAVIFACGGALAEPPVTVFAAASLKSALDEVVQGFDGQVTVSYGGSGLIARQVAAGAPADVVILANADWMDGLVDQGYVQPQSRRNLAGNSLVLIGPNGAEAITELTSETIKLHLKAGRLAVGNSRSVPAGVYARQWLSEAGLWTDLQSHLAETENVRAALALVSRNEAPLGVVYASDAQADPRVEVVYWVPAKMHQPIRYPAAIVRGGEMDAARIFMDHLFSKKSRKIFINNGFSPPEDAL